MLKNWENNKMMEIGLVIHTLIKMAPLYWNSPKIIVITTSSKLFVNFDILFTDLYG